LVAETVVQKWVHGNCYRTVGADFEAMRAHSREPGHAIAFAGDYFADVSGTIEDATRSGIETARTVSKGLDALLDTGRLASRPATTGA
jgi:hypothetical protein